MKFPFWDDPNDNISIIEPTEEDMNKYGHSCGSDVIKLSNKHMEALKNKKMLAWNDGEYTTFLVLIDDKG